MADFVQGGDGKSTRCAAMTTRKQIDKLTAADFDAFPVWEFASDEEGFDGQDECTVRPFNQPGPIDASAGMFVIRSTFTFADGTSAVGYVTPPNDADDDLGAIQPVIVTEGGQIMFWWGILEPKRDWIDFAYRQLDRSPSEVFPIQFLSDIDSTYGLVSGTILGFMQIGDHKINTIR